MIAKFSNWYFTKKSLPHWGILILDCVIVGFSVLLGEFFEANQVIYLHHLPAVLAGMLITVLLFCLSFRIFHTYTGIVRYSTFVDLQRVALAVLVGSLLTWVVSALLSSVEAIDMPSFLGVCILFVMATLLMWLERVTVKRLFDSFRIDDAAPVAIYGTKAGGISLAKSLTGTDEKRYRLVAFISDSPDMKGTYLMGKKVFMNGEGIAERMREMGVRILLVSPLKSELFRNNQAMVDEFIAAGITLKMLATAQEWDGKSKLTHQHLHEVEIEDLLPREKIEVDMDAIAKQLRGKKVLITGAAGFYR